MAKWCPVSVDVRRVCLLEEDIERYDLPTYEPKAGDSKADNWAGDECAELESMGDDEIPERIHEEIAKVLDLEALEELREQEQELTTTVREALEDLL